MNPFPHRDFFNLAARSSDTGTRNRLQSASDKELYLALYYLGAGERRQILNLLSREKAARVEEIFRRGIRFGREEYLVAVNHLIAHLSRETPEKPLRSWYRPGKPRA